MAHNFQLSDPALLFKGGWINGQSYTASSGQDFAVDDPSTGREWRRETEMDAGDTQLAIKAANDAFPAFSALSARERAKLLMNLHNEFEKAKDDLAMIMVMEAGKPFSEAKGEVDFCGMSLLRRTNDVLIRPQPTAHGSPLANARGCKVKRSKASTTPTCDT